MIKKKPKKMGPGGPRIKIWPRAGGRGTNFYRGTNFFSGPPQGPFFFGHVNL